ncbi:hypothetical protein GCM10009583_33420 [Ornithinicoccus hortensis]
MRRGTPFGQSEALEGLNVNVAVCLDVAADQHPMVSVDEFQNTSDRPVQIQSVALVNPEAGLALEEWIVELQAGGRAGTVRGTTAVEGHSDPGGQPAPSACSRRDEA